MEPIIKPWYKSTTFALCVAGFLSPLIVLLANKIGVSEVLIFKIVDLILGSFGLAGIYIGKEAVVKNQALKQIVIAPSLDEQKKTL